MQIKTSRWFATMPPEHLKIGISRGVPRGMAAGYRIYKTLAPGAWFNSVSADEYRRLYFDEVLGRLDVGRVRDDIAGMADTRTAVLVCYEDPKKFGDWCHRGYVSAWLHDKLGLEVPELGHEAKGFGWHHPMLPATHRAAGAPPLFDITQYLGQVIRDAQGNEWVVARLDVEPERVVMTCGDRERVISREVVIARLG